MPIAPGTEVYNVDAAPVVARGIIYTDDDLTDAVTGPVAEILRDDAGIEELEEMLAGVETTDFERTHLESILSAPPVTESWRVGEAFAETYLVDHCDCFFPWQGSRDLKSSTASPAGADLVGFKQINNGNTYQYTFGEVKTSQADSYPPNVMYGRHGMTTQLENLRDKKDVQDQLIRYLGHHAIRSEWREQYRSATSTYLADASNISLYGFLVRDVVPNRLDLASRATVLATNCPPTTRIEIKALYLPANSIERLCELANRPEGGRNVAN